MTDERGLVCLTPAWREIKVYRKYKKRFAVTFFPFFLNTDKCVQSLVGGRLNSLLEDS